MSYNVAYHFVNVIFKIDNALWQHTYRENVSKKGENQSLAHGKFCAEAQSLWKWMLKCHTTL